MTSLRDRALFPVLYMFVITFVLTAALVGIARVTAERVEANKAIMLEEAILLAAGIDETLLVSPSAIHDLFVSRIEGMRDEWGGAYALTENGEPTVYMVPFEGQGFWNMIRGVIGVRVDRVTVTGIAFYEQNETPGLGAEITKSAFRDQFKGLSMQATGSALGLRPGGSELTGNEVHAVTGATQTCTRLEGILNAAIKEWRRRLEAVDGQ